MNKSDIIQKSIELIEGATRTKLLFLFAHHNMADILRDGTKSSHEVASQLQLRPDVLHRIFRRLATLGVLEEEEEGFRLSPIGELFRTDVEGSLRDYTLFYGGLGYSACMGLQETLKDGGTSFDHVFQQSFFEFLAAHPDESEIFNRCMAHRTQGTNDQMLDDYDFSSFSTIVDVGGGHGALLAGILQRYPHLNGILFDQAHVVEKAGSSLVRAGLAERCKTIGGSFFEAVPSGGDVYLLKWIIHDWDDEKCIQILTHCHKALQGKGKLLLFERIMSERAIDSPEAIRADIIMLTIAGGKERTKSEYQTLLERSGFEMTNVIQTKGPFSIIEGTPV